MGEEPDAAAPAMPLTSMAMARQHRDPGDTLALALARGRAAEAREEPRARPPRRLIRTSGPRI